MRESNKDKSILLLRYVSIAFLLLLIAGCHKDIKFLAGIWIIDSLAINNQESHSVLSANMLTLNEDLRGILPLVDEVGNRKCSWGVVRKGGRDFLEINSKGSPFEGLYQMDFFIDASGLQKGKFTSHNVVMECTKMPFPNSD
jgi:hypothetical protein